MRKDSLIGESDAFLSALDHASQLATIDRPILILGERGTGKELIAQRLHFLSKRWDEPLVSLNCAALSSGTLDSELLVMMQVLLLEQNSVIKVDLNEPMAVHFF